MKHTIIGAAVALSVLAMPSAFAAITSSTSSALLEVGGYWSDGVDSDESNPNPLTTTASGSHSNATITNPQVTSAFAGYSGTATSSMNDGFATTGIWSATGSITGNAYANCVACPGGFSFASANSAISWTTNFTLGAADVFSLSYSFTAASDFVLPPTLAFVLSSVDEFDVLTDTGYSTPLDPSVGSLVYSNAPLAAGNYRLELFLSGFTSIDSESLIPASLFSGTSSVDMTVGGSPVPLPAAAWLLLSGMGGLGAMVRRRRKAA